MIRIHKICVHNPLWPKGLFFGDFRVELLRYWVPVHVNRLEVGDTSQAAFSIHDDALGCDSSADMRPFVDE